MAVFLARWAVSLALLSAVGSLGNSAAAKASAMPIGSLIPSRTGEALGPVAVSGGEVFVGAPDATLHVQDQGAVFVYSTPASGWSGAQTEAAVLITSDADPGDRLGEWVATAGPDVVVGGAAGKLYVFAPPSGGWSGEIHPTAVLSATDGVKLSGPVVSGQTIVAQGIAPNTPGAVYVFTEPAGGWSGTVHQSAKLTASDGTPGDGLGASIAVSGNTIVAGAPEAKVGSQYPGAVYVFTEPAGGWAVTQHEIAKLTGSDISTDNGPVPTATYFGSSVALSGSAVVATLPVGPGAVGAVYVFTEPQGGWASETQAAKLVPQDGLISAGSPFGGLGAPYSSGSPMLAISGDTVVAPGAEGSSFRRPAEFVFTKPSGGWSGTQNESATLMASDGQSLGSPVILGQYVAAGELTGASAQTLTAVGAVYVFEEPANGWSGTLTETAKLADQSGGPPAGGEDLYREPGTGWSSGPPSGVLAPSGSPDLVSFASMAVSGPTVVADEQGSAYVFIQPPEGWASDEPSATLTDPNLQLGTVAISGSTIAALAHPGSNALYNPTQASGIDVFTEPATGWSGTIAPAAHLVASDGALFVALAVDGSTVVAAGFGRSQSMVYVFTEPAGGWSGTVNESARLTLPRNTYPRSISIDGAEVVVNGVASGSTVAAPGEAYLFTEPVGGWHGFRRASATLSPGYYDGTVEVYRQPARGWKGVVHPAARLSISTHTSGGGPGIAGEAISGDTIAVTAYAVGKYQSCPCGGGVWLFSRPAAGWSGTLRAPQFVPAMTDGDGQIALGLDPSVLFVGGQTIPMDQETMLDLYPVPRPVTESPIRAGNPSAHAAQLRGLVHRKPRLEFTLSAGANAAPIASVTITPPDGLEFRTRRFWHSVFSSDEPVRARLEGGKLTVAPPYPVSELAVTLHWPALVESAALVRRVRGIRAGGGHGRPVRLAFRTMVTVTNASGHRTELAIRTGFLVRPSAS